ANRACAQSGNAVPVVHYLPCGHSWLQRRPAFLQYQLAVRGRAMTKQTVSQKCLGGSPAGISFFRLCTLNLAAMWATLVNQSSGGRILGQSLEMHSVDTSKTRFFDTLSTNSTGYGGDPYDVSYFKASKGRFYDFAGSFRRDRSYFDYNLLGNSLLSTS